MTATLRRGALVAFSAAACAALYLISPAPYPLCPFRALTGLDCPFCGATRALHASVHGDFVRALDLNPLIVLGIPVVAVAWVFRRRLSPRVLWASAIVLVGFAVARNLPLAALSWMSSYR